MHTGEKPFQCCLCGNRFTQPANLRTHTKKKHRDGPIQGCRCPHCSETYPSIVAIHQHILEDHQNIVAEEREVQNMEKIQKEKEKEDRDKAKEIARQKREERKKERIDFNDFRSKGLKEWEINYEFHLGEEMKKGVDWDRAPTNGELECEECNQTFGYRYEIMFHRLCHLTDEEGYAKNKVCPECDTVFKVPIGLKHHLILHTGELPFLCLHCWRSFSAHIDLKLHIRREHLFHLDVPQPTKPAKRKSIKDEQDTKKKIKREEIGGSEPSHSRAVIIQNGQEQEPQHITVNVGENGQIINAHELGENVQFLQTESGQIIATTGESNNPQIVNATNRAEGEQQTILIGADGQIINTGNQDMIVVIQSDEMEANPGGLIVVDASQLQQMVGNSSDGSVPQIAIAQGADGQTMIIQQQGGSHESVNITQSQAARSHTVAQSTASSGQQMIISEVAGNTVNGESNVQEGTQYISFQVNEDGTAVPTTTRPGGEQVVMVNAANGQQVANINGKNYVIVSQQEGNEQNDSSSAAATTVVTMTPDDQAEQTNTANVTVSVEQQRQNQEALSAMVQLATSNTTNDNEATSPTKEIKMVVQAASEKERGLVGEIMETQKNVQNNTESVDVKVTNLLATENMPPTDEELNEEKSGQELKAANNSIVVTAENKEN